MERDATEIHIDKDAARAGITPHIMRYVLIVSTLLAIIALSAIWITGALSNTETHESAALEQPAAQMGETP